MLELKTEWKDVDLGDGITVKIKPLNLRAYHRMLAFLLPHMKDGQVDSQAVMVDENLPDILEDIFPDHVSEVRGVTLDGKVPTSLELAQNAQLLTQCILTLGELLTLSTLNKEELGN